MLRKLVVLSTVVTCLVLQGCVTIKAPPSMTIVNEQKVSDRNYTLGRPSEAVVGADMIRVRDFALTDVAVNEVEVTSDFAFNHTIYTHSFKAGEIYPYIGTIEYQGKMFNLMRVESFGIMFDDNGAIFNKIVNGIGGTTAPSPVVMIYQFDPSPPGVHVKRLVGRRAIGGAGVNYQIVFTGITSDSMRFNYREYSATDLTRPAFSQELTYPVNSREIRFKELVIGINRVAADRINFTVISDGSKAAAPTAPPPPPNI